MEIVVKKAKSGQHNSNFTEYIIMKDVLIDSYGHIYNSDRTEIGKIQYTENTIKRIEIYQEYQSNKFGKAAIREFCQEKKNEGFEAVYIACITNPKLISIAESFEGYEVSSHKLPISPHPVLEREKPDYKIPLIETSVF